MNLLQALRLPTSPGPAALRLALVGAGGKSAALFTLARRLAAPARLGDPAGSVLVSTTTHLAPEQRVYADLHFTLNSPADLPAASQPLPAGVLLFTGPAEALAGGETRLGSPPAPALAALCRLAQARGLPLLLEADGARRRPLKAPAAHEPALPEWIDTLLVVAGLSGLGQPLSEAWVHRPERFAALTGLAQGQPINPEAVARLLAHPQGGLKGCPPGARRLALLTQADTPLRQAQGAAIAAAIVPPFAAAVIAALRLVESEPGEQAGLPGAPAGERERICAVHEPVAAIVLAAGGSSRLGQPKQLLEWRGLPLVRHAARAACQAGLAPVVIVTGAEGDDVWRAAQAEASAADSAALGSPLEPLQRAHNPDWAAGQSTSLRAGLAALPQDCGAAVFLLADQPQVSPLLLQALVERHAATLAPVVAPYAGGRRANPVLFDRSTFPELLRLTGDTGGRALFSRYPIEAVEWLAQELLLDVDTPEDFARLQDLGA